MTNKERYAAWTATQPDLPIFMQPWWMDAVCAGKEWDVLLVYAPGVTEADTDTISGLKQIVAAMPYLLRHKWRFRYVLMPQQTQIGGVWVNPDIPEDKKEQTYQHIAQDIRQKLSDLHLDYYYQQYPIGSKIAELLGGMGMQVRQRVTYRIEDTRDLLAIRQQWSKNKSRQLKKAESAGLVVDMNLRAEEFYRAHCAALREQGKSISYSREFLLVLERKAARAHRSQFIGIRTSEGKLCGAAWLVWDSRSMYYLIPFYSPKYKDTGVGALLVMESLRLAQSMGLSFDFEGSMNRGIANHYRQFGSQPTTYYSVEWRRSWIFRLILWMQKLKS